MGGGGGGQGGGGGGFQNNWGNRGGQGGYAQDGTQYSVPADKCGLVIGKGTTTNTISFN